jgi:hypothetical protein
MSDGSRQAWVKVPIPMEKMTNTAADERVGDLQGEHLSLADRIAR